MSQILQVYKKYRISNAEVRPIPPKFQTSELTVQWVISTRTVIEEIPADDEVMPVKFSYSKFTDLVQYMDDKTKSVGKSFNALLLMFLHCEQIFKNPLLCIVQTCWELSLVHLRGKQLSRIQSNQMFKNLSCLMKSKDFNLQFSQMFALPFFLFRCCHFS